MSRIRRGCDYGSGDGSVRHCRRLRPTGWSVVNLGPSLADFPRQGPLPNAAYGMAINNLGNVAYTLNDGSGNPDTEMAYFYNKSGKASVSCGALYPGYPLSNTFGINDNNIVVGDYYTYNASADTITTSAMAWKWNGANGGTMVDLVAVSGGFGSPGAVAPSKRPTRSTIPTR